MSEGPTAKTATLEEGVLDALVQDAGPISLVMFHRGGAHVVPLLEGVPVVVGRAAPSDLTLDDPNLSRTHARFTLRPDGVWIEDLESTNGTRINGRPVTAATRVGLGDGVRLGALAVAIAPLESGGLEPGAARSTELLGQSAAMDALRGLIARVAPSEVAVLVTGETGTGKELVARAIHAASARAAGPMRSVNCGALQSSLLMSALFGHERGAFTGAEQRAPGLFEQAHGGTLFLDEVGELTADAQAALLRVLETGTLRRVGGTDEVRVDVRVVAATHRDLTAMGASGAFREDLRYRLNTVVIEAPPLRARPDDVELLARAFLREAAARHRRPVTALSPEAVSHLVTHPWPGNVRELRNTIERAVVLAAGPTITAEELPAELVAPGGEAPPTQSPEVDFKAHIQRYEAKLMLSALAQAGGNKTEAARRLRMPVRTFVHKFRAFGLKALSDRSGG